MTAAMLADAAYWAVLILFGVGLGGLVVGLLVARWWALLLAFLIPVAFIPAGTDWDGSQTWGWALLLLSPPALLGLALGVAIRKASSPRSPVT
jgi:hypothetical protein